MRVIIIGATGRIGAAVARALAGRHEIVPVSRSTDNYRVDITVNELVESLFVALGPFDALVATTGQAAYKPFDDLTDDDFQWSLSNKLMGQVNVVRAGVRHARNGGSFTLAAGSLARDPSPGSAAVSLVNAGIEAFVAAAALEMPRAIRINAVSPEWVSESLASAGKNPAGGVPVADVARAFVESVEGRDSGKVFDVRAPARKASAQR